MRKIWQKKEKGTNNSEMCLTITCCLIKAGTRRKEVRQGGSR